MIQRIGPPLDDPEAWRGFDMNTAEKWWNACTGARRREVLRILKRGSTDRADRADRVWAYLTFGGASYIPRLYAQLPVEIQEAVQGYFEREVRTRADA